MRIELSILHDGKNWIAKNENLEISAPTLEDLDGRLRTTLREKGWVKKGERRDVYMFSDNAAMIPEWMRPYSQHYFNRIIKVIG